MKTANKILEQIRSLLAEERSYDYITNVLGVSKSTISKVKQSMKQQQAAPKEPAGIDLACCPRPGPEVLGKTGNLATDVFVLRLREIARRVRTWKMNAAPVLAGDLENLADLMEAIK